MSNRKEGRFFVLVARSMGERIHSTDWSYREGEKATLLRAEGKEKEAWAVVKGWCTMARQTKDREDLYARREPPGDPIPCNASPPPPLRMALRRAQ